MSRSSSFRECHEQQQNNTDCVWQPKFLWNFQWELSVVGIAETWLVREQFPCRKMLWSCQKRSCKLGSTQCLHIKRLVASDTTSLNSPSAAGQLTIASEERLNTIHLEKIATIPAREISKGFFSNTSFFCTFKSLCPYKQKLLLFILMQLRSQRELFLSEVLGHDRRSVKQYQSAGLVTKKISRVASRILQNSPD